MKKIIPLIALSLTLWLPAPAGAQVVDETNSGQATYDETDPKTYAVYTNTATGEVTAEGTDGTALTVDTFKNEGTVIGAGTSTGVYGTHGIGIQVKSGGFTNTGTVNATGSGFIAVYPPTSNTAIDVSGGFTNSGIVNATSNDLGIGIRVSSGGFDNSGTVTASSSWGHGIQVDQGGFTNSGTVNATGTDAVGIGIRVNSGGFDNSGTVNATGTDGRGSGSIGIGIRVDCDFTNSGTVNATGGINGIAIYINYANFTNSGTVNATGNDGGAGIGVWGSGTSNGYFINSGAVNATGGTGGYGIIADYANFINSGTVTATGTDGGYGIRMVPSVLTNNSGNFNNSGTVNATAAGGGYGILVHGGDFNNTGGQLNLFGGSQALYFSADGSQFSADGASTLMLGGGGMTFEQNGVLDLTGSPRLALPETLGQTLGDKIYTVATSTGGTLTYSGLFTLPRSGVIFGYGQGLANSDKDYNVTVTRKAYASALTGGAAAPFIASLETALAAEDFGNWSGYPEPGDPRFPWANLMSDINDSASVPELQAKSQRAARLESAQATGQSVVLISEGSRQVNSNFSRELTRRHGPSAPASGDGEAGRTSLWVSPLYFHGKQKADDNALSTVDADWYGASFGASHSPTDRFAWGLGLHFLHGDLDGGHEYDADSDAWGVDAAFTARPQWGGFRPILTGAFSASRHDFEQTRRDSDGSRYDSDPDVKTTTLAVSAAHDFSLTGDNRLTLRPKVGLDWTRAKFDGYHERTVSGGRPLSVSGDSFDSLRSDLGAALLWSPSDVVDLELRAAWLHEWQDRSPMMHATAQNIGWSLATPSADPSRDAAALGASVSWSPTESFALSLDYDATLGDQLRGHSLAGSLRWDF